MKFSWTLTLLAMTAARVLIKYVAPSFAKDSVDSMMAVLVILLPLALLLDLRSWRKWRKAMRATNERERGLLK